MKLESGCSKDGDCSDNSSSASTAIPSVESEEVQDVGADPVLSLRSRATWSLPVPPNLEGLKSRRRPVLSLKVSAEMQKPDGGSSSSAASMVEITLQSRVSLVGLSSEYTDELMAGLTDSKARLDQTAVGKLQLWQHPGLQVAIIDSASDLEEQFAAAAFSKAHVICVKLSALRGRGGACAGLRTFKGGLLVLEEGIANDIDLDLEAAVASNQQCVHPEVMPESIAGEVMGDLKLKDVDTRPEVRALVEAAEPLYEDSFHASLEDDLRSWEGSLLGLLLRSSSSSSLLGKATEGTSQGNKGARNDSPREDELLGLIVYKHWGPPLRAMSILRLAVPQRYRMQGFGRQLMRWAMEKARQKPRSECARVTLCSMPEAIAFYERLQFTPMPLEDLCPLPEEEGEGQRMPGALWMEYRCGRSYKPVGKR